MRLPRRFYRHTPRRISHRTNSVPNSVQNINQCLRCPGSRKDGNGGDNIAVLIDADNVSHRALTSVMAEVSKGGTVSVRRIYGDWTNPTMSTWRESILHHSIVPIQQFAYASGKNSSDGAMMVDAMDLLYTDRFSRFCLITSDSDFTRLVTRIREQGAAVHGFGRDHTHRAFVAACSKFFYLNDLSPSSGLQKRESIPLPPPTPVAPNPPNTPWSWRAIFSGGSSTSTTPTHLTSAYQNEDRHADPTPLTSQPEPLYKPKPLDQAALENIRKTIIERRSDKDHLINMGFVGECLNRLPDFNFRYFGYKRLRDFFQASGIVELKMKHGQMMVKLKDRRNDITAAHISVPPSPRNDTNLDPIPLDQAVVDGIRKVILDHQMTANRDMFIDLNFVSQRLLKLSPDFHFLNYGFSRPHDFILASGIVEQQTKASPLIKLKDWREGRNSAVSPHLSRDTVILEHKPHDQTALKNIQAAVLENCQGDPSSFVNLGTVSNSLRDLSPDLAPSSYGYQGVYNFNNFILASGIIEWKREGKVTVRLTAEWRIANTTATEPLTASLPPPSPAQKENPATSHVQPFEHELHDRVASALVKFGDGWRNGIKPTTKPNASIPLPAPVEEIPAISIVRALEDHTALEAIRMAITHLNRYNRVDDFVGIPAFGRHLAKPPPETGAAALDYRDYGFSSLRNFLQASKIVDLRWSNSTALVRLKDPREGLTPLSTQPPTPLEEPPTPSTLSHKPIDEAAFEGIRQTITAIPQDDADPFAYVPFTRFANDYLTKLPPTLHHHHYGFPQLRDFVLASGIVELEWQDTTALIRLKANHFFDRTTLAVLRAAISACPPYKGGSFVKVSDVGKCLLKVSPDFKPENHGFSRLRDFVLASGVVEMHKVGSAVLVRLWDECELGEASRGERERNVREMMKEGEDKSGSEDGNRSALASKDALDPREDGMPMPSASRKDEHEQGHIHQTPLALVLSEPEDLDREHDNPPELNDNHGYKYRTSLSASMHRPEEESHEPAHLEHQIPSDLQAEPTKEPNPSSSAASPLQPPPESEHCQQGIGIPLTSDYGPDEHEPSPSPAPENKHEPALTHEFENSSTASKNEPKGDNNQIPQTSEPEPESKSEPEQEPEQEPKPKTTPLASLARSFFFSEHR